MQPTLFLGTRAGGRLLEADSGYADAGLAYNLLARTGRLAPAGVGGEAVFHALYLATAHTAAAHLRVRVLVDGVVVVTKTIALAASVAEARKVHELNLSVPYLVNGVEELRTRPRGTWIEVEVATVYDGVASMLAAEQVVEGVELEHEVVREGQREAVAAA